MADREIKRRLAAILAADIEGFSRLMGEDEEATVATLRGHRDVTDRLIGEHGGRIANTAGDSIIAVFDSAVEAVRAAVAIQDELAPLNANLSEERRVRYRIGVNLGDVILEGGDVLGDGVNIAARLEGLAAAGGICISRTIFDQVSGKLPYTYDDIGDRQVKNIAQPVRAYRIVTGSTAAKAAHATGFRLPKLAIIGIAGLVLVLAAAGWYWQSGQPAGSGPSTAASQRSALSIVVLPFTNATGDPKQGYIADGITASLTSDLSRIRDAFVVATATAFTYKNKTVNLKQLGADLGVRFVLQGSVQRGGNTIRINAQLADTQTNAQLWAETFEGDQSNLFALQDKVTARIGNSIGREMVVAAARESEKRESNPLAADLILRARAAALKPQSLQNWERIEGWYRQALELDPNNANAMVGLARSLAITAFNFRRELTLEVKEKKFVEGRDYAVKAKELDPGNPMVYSVLALYAATHNDFPA
ncbi:MAG: adenylate/guanylate cyclase domain-containing protein [Alphaproteobacteria bacterium]